MSCKYVIPSYQAPVEQAKAPLTEVEQTAILTVLKAALATPRTFEELCGLLQTDATLTAATKRKCDGERIGELVARAVEAGQRKTL